MPDALRPDAQPRRTGSRLVVFFGNCQARALLEIYRRHFANLHEEQVVGCELDNVDDALLASADVVVEQLFNRPRIKPDTLRPHTTHIRFPVMMAQFLWPYSGQPHSRNRRYPFLAAGPYPDEMGDSFLNRLIDVVPEDEAFERYCQLDIATHVGLDRLFEMHLEHQRIRDQVAGIDIAGFIDARFRNEKLFTTRGHPSKKLFDHVARIVFAAMGVPDRMIEIALCSNAYSPFESQELPIHPNLAAHFRLRYATATTQYRHQAEGGFTFAQYVRRYLRYEWNRELYQALHLWEGRETDDALALLDRALLTSPCSPAGLRLKAHLHLRQNDLPAARAAALGAVAAAPDDPDLHAQVAEVALAQGDLLGAEAALCTAMVFLPGSVRFHIPLAEVLQRAGRAGEAADLLAGLAEQTPGDARLLGRLGWAYRHLPDLQAAEAMFRRAIEADPSYDNARIGLVSTLNELGRHDESLAQLRGMVAADSKDPETYVHLGHLLRERSDLAGAEASFGRAIELAPTWTALHDALASVRRAKQQAGATVPP
jgi:tetratricopeptide (TPR) repeat protein